MKICVGLSGGVDSSVAALLLKQEGYDVFAMFMQNWHDADATLHGDCEWEEDRFVAELVARKIGIPFYFVDLSKEYRQRVVDYMFNEYSAGRTPNPDVLCNREIKFDAFLKAAQKLGADMVATGHYCRRAPLMDAEGKQVVIDGLPQWRILEGVDPNKDQSYFLCQLTQEQLGKALFPIGNLTKPEVREIAREADLPSADKKDSQGICFVGKVDLPTFLQQKLKPAEGNVVEVYDAYYAQSEQYRFVHDTLASLLETPGEPMMITEYTSEDSGGKPFNNRRVTDNNSPVTEPATPRHSDKLSATQVQQPQSLSVTEPATPRHSDKLSAPQVQQPQSLSVTEPATPRHSDKLSATQVQQPQSLSVTEPATPRHSDKLSAPQVQQPQSLSVTEPVEVTKSTGKTDWSEYGSEASALPSQSRLACGDPHVHEATGGHGSGATSTPTERLSHRNEFDVNKIAELSDEDLMRLSEPIWYDDIKFETETYRAGKKHIKKTRYKENPFGKIVGRHDGAQFYTIGQRKGLNIGGHKDSIFVIATDVPRNIIYVGESHTHKGLSRCCLRIAPQDIHWIRTDLAMADGEIRRYRVRIRYRQPLQDAFLIKRPAGIFILFDTPQRGISDGQFAAWYSSDDEMLGSGVY